VWVKQYWEWFIPPIYGDLGDGLIIIVLPTFMGFYGPKI
jgi:hypothetical protein